MENNKMKRSQKIQKNLANFGINDIKVIAIIKIKEKYGDTTAVVGEIKIGPIKLSNLCACYEKIWGKSKQEVSQNKKVLDYNAKIFSADKNQPLGYIDSDSRFNFLAAPNLRLCVGWAVASDLGRNKVVEYNLDLQIKKLNCFFSLINKITNEERLKQCFGYFVSLLEIETMKYGIASRFSDAFCSYSNLFWKVGTRKNGKEHSGFPISH
jgi:hypothetical protein